MTFIHALTIGGNDQQVSQLGGPQRGTITSDLHPHLELWMPQASPAASRAMGPAETTANSSAVKQARLCD
jgi:hypothetical protein